MIRINNRSETTKNRAGNTNIPTRNIWTIKITALTNFNIPHNTHRTRNYLIFAIMELHVSTNYNWSTYTMISFFHRPRSL